MSRTAARPPTSEWVALAVLSASMLMIILDGTIVSVALPALRDDLGFSSTGLSWTVNAYLLPLGGLLLLAGRLGDLLGRRRVLIAGLALFVTASILCGLAVGPAMLVGARALQGIGAALASSVVLGMIVALFPDDADRARAMGAYAFVGAAGASIGLLLGGFLTEALGWRSIFLVNVPIGLAAIVLALRVLARDPARDRGTRPDVLGAALVTVGLVALVLAIVEPAVPRLAVGAAAVVLLAGFVVRQAHARTPLVPLRVLRTRSIAVGNLAQILLVSAMLGFQFVTAIYLQQVGGYTPAQTGLAMTPVAVVIGAVALRVAGPLMTRFTPRHALLAGIALLVPGFVLLVVWPGTAYATHLLPALLLLGLGAGLTMPAVVTVVMSDADEETAGLASGLANTGQQIGGALGTALLAAVAAAHTDTLRAAGTPGTEALAGGYRAAYMLAIALLVGSALLTTFLLPRRPAAASPAPVARDSSPVDVVATAGCGG